jgi:hypothetical protein
MNTHIHEHNVKKNKILKKIEGIERERERGDYEEK